MSIKNKDAPWVLAIDPGVNAIGVALFEGDLVPKRAVVIQHTARELRSITWEHRTCMLISRLENSGIHNSVDDIVVEWPEVMSGVVGNAAAKRGDVSRLAHCCGLVHRLAVEYSKQFRLISVREWKGQLSKDNVEMRLRRIARSGCDLSGEKIKTHAWDAMGIGLHHLGYSMDHQVLARA